MITRMKMIREYRVFRSFSWPKDLPVFGAKNIIYGWNGSGKSTLAGLFKHLEAGLPVTEGKVVFELEGGSTIRGDQISAGDQIQVRVFDQDFVRETVERSRTGLGHVYYLGKESIEKQAQIEGLKQELTKAENDARTLKEERAALEGRIQEYGTDAAAKIWAVLRAIPSVRAFNRSHFVRSVERLRVAGSTPVPLADADSKALLLQGQATQKAPTEPLSEPAIGLGDLAATVTALLAETLTPAALGGESPSREVRDWLERGLPLHRGQHQSLTCQFCGQMLPEERLSAIEGLFDAAHEAHKRRLSTCSQRIEQAIKKIERLAEFKDTGVLDALASDFYGAVVEVKAAALEVQIGLGSLDSEIARKRDSPFKALSLGTDPTSLRSRDARLSAAIQSVNRIVESNNTQLLDLESVKSKAVVELEDRLVGSHLVTMNQLQGELTKLDGELKIASAVPSGLKSRIAELEREIRQYMQPSAELNADLAAYLGRDELIFQANDTGYRLTRKGEPALHLSEGERTAIAFLYFLKRLQDAGLDRASAVVVIDDPVSSLDANNLYSAYAFLRARTEGCGQLFLLTHSFPFFRQARKLASNKSQNFYLLRASLDKGAGTRTAIIEAIPDSLRRFESDYHFLFHRVVEGVVFSDSGRVSAEVGYELPSIGRRLVESFLAFRHPDKTRLVADALAQTAINAEDKSRLERFLNVYSHGDHIMATAHDPVALGETPLILRSILRTIRQLDPSHYNGMLSAIDQPCPL